MMYTNVATCIVNPNSLGLGASISFAEPVENKDTEAPAKFYGISISIFIFDFSLGVITEEV